MGGLTLKGKKMKYINEISIMIIASMICGPVLAKSLEDRDQEYAEYIEATGLRGIEEIISFKYSNSNPLSNKFLTIFANKDDKFLIELVEPCQQLYSSTSIHLDQFSDYKLSTKDAYVVNNRRCRIKSIYPLSNEQHIRILEIMR